MKTPGSMVSSAAMESIRYPIELDEVGWGYAEDTGRKRTADETFDPSSGLSILPILRGLTSSDVFLCSWAMDEFDRVVDDLAIRLQRPENKALYAGALAKTAVISAQIYRQIILDLPRSRSAACFDALTALWEHGAFFACKLLLKKHISSAQFLQLIQGIPENQRLRVADQYIQADPYVRLQHAQLFKDILSSLTCRDIVVQHYAWLFDRRCWADPFLNHIDPGLRDTRALMENEIASQSPELVIKGLKALAMMAGEVPSRVLLDTLDRWDDMSVTLTVYSIIEQSARGRYPELFEPVWQRMCTNGTLKRLESTAAFRALVVTGRFSPSVLVDKIKSRSPEILPDLLQEVVRLSRIAFFFIQDMALNKDKYEKDHPDMVRACLLGMVRKRPERVGRVVSLASKALKDHGIQEFSKKLKGLLLKESERIRSGFNLNHVLSGKIKYTRLTRFDKEYLMALGENKGVSDGPVRFSRQLIQGLHLCGLDFSAQPLECLDTLVKHANWSKIYLCNSRFNGSILFNVDISQARFENVCFDRVQFRHVRAKGAVFRNCSFIGAKLFKCDFSGADLSDALFTRAAVSRTQFCETNLSFASFAHARLSAVSFITASLEQADFSYVRALFVRYPGYAYPACKVTGINLNDRYFNLDMDDLPAFSPGVQSEINLMIFCEFTRFGRRKFLEQNRISLLTALDIFKPDRAALFHMVPLLLHHNIQLRGTGAIDPETPCGILDYMPSNRALSLVQQYAVDWQPERKIEFNPDIDGLFTMGSTGSLAQTPKSDIDYWVCINGKNISRQGIDLLKQKLEVLKKLSQEVFDTDVTFFIVDIHKVRHNDFGGMSAESSGSAQASLLKEEFYRTMIHVAGKLPLWAVLPAGLSRSHYDIIYQRVTTYTASRRYIDLGDVHSIPANEYLGAAIWQMYKWLKSPFKSVIKQALFELYALGGGKDALLCNAYKTEWLNSGIHLRFARNDSYLSILNKLLTHYRDAGDEASMDIILTCFFLKLEIRDSKELDDTAFGIRKILLERILAKWGWSLDRVLALGRFRQWPYDEARRLSARIQAYMFAKYDQMKIVCHPASQTRLLISDTDREVLTREVDVVYKEKAWKIKKQFLIAANDACFSNLSVRYNGNTSPSTRWELRWNRSKSGRIHSASLFKSDRIEHLCAWMIYNQFYKKESQLAVGPNDARICSQDVDALYVAMTAFFTRNPTPMDRFYGRASDLPVIDSVFVTINFEASDRQVLPVMDYCTVYRNSWGEMFCHPSDTSAVFTTDDHAKKAILDTVGISGFPLNTQFYYPQKNAV